MAEELKRNTCLKELNFHHTYAAQDIFVEICNTLKASPTISSFSFSWVDPAYTMQEECLSDVLNAKKLKKMALKCNTIDLLYFSEALKNSTDLADLSFTFKTMDIQLLGEVISANKSIKVLYIFNEDMAEKDILDLHLEKNSSLERLTIASGNLTGENIFNILKENASLKSLTIENNLHLAGAALEEFLKKNKTLTELDLRAGYNNLRMCKYLMDGLKTNKTLRKIFFSLENQIHSTVIKFLKDLKNNTVLTHLGVGDMQNCGKEMQYFEDERVVDVVFDVLKTNKTLRYIEGSEEIPEIDELLKENRAEQDRVTDNIRLWIKMILTKPSSFILPVEVWSNIFKHVSFPFLTFDFEKLFLESMA